VVSNVKVVQTSSPSCVGRHIMLQASPRLVEDHGVVLVLTRDTLLGGDQACSLHYPQSIAARLMSPRCHYCGAPKCKRCDRRVRASSRAGPSDWPAHREAKQYQKHHSLESRLLHYIHTPPTCLPSAWKHSHTPVSSPSSPF